ncbi:MAG: hypothetical protein ABGX83_04320 [Nitrospira sp.]|nr:hypothetical protein [Candidatus Manganitrophaceae bacterium]HIL35352.1 hypothetical protein [Candidatus Manganitrophaceae bacterium]
MNRIILFLLLLFFALLYPVPPASAETRGTDSCRDRRSRPIAASLSVPYVDYCGSNRPFSLGQSASDPIPEFCPVLREILLSAWKKFKPIRGKLDLISEEYFGTLIPPGQESCFSWLNGSTYHCRSREGMGLDEVGTLYEATNRSVRQCLSENWTSEEITVDRVGARRSTLYKSALHRVEIQVRERNKRSGWQLVLYFRR